MKSLLEEILRVVASIWQIGNLWLRRIAVTAILVLLGMLVAAMLVPQKQQITVIPILALIPVAGIIFLALQWPVVIAASATVEVGRKALRAVSLALAADLIFGIYLSLVPFKEVVHDLIVSEILLLPPIKKMTVIAIARRIKSAEAGPRAFPMRSNRIVTSARTKSGTSPRSFEIGTNERYMPNMRSAARANETALSALRPTSTVAEAAITTGH